MSILLISRGAFGGLVVPRKAVDTALNKNEAELGILILTVPVKMLAHGNGLLDKHVQALW